MIIFGFEPCSKEWPSKDVNVVWVRCDYIKLTLFFIFTLVVAETWYKIGRGGGENKVSHGHILKVLGKDAPNLNLWERYSLLILGVFLYYWLRLA